MKNFKDLKVWKKAHRLTLAIYKATYRYPKDELYGLTSQIKRSSVSVPSNVAEGFRRYHSREYRQFLYIALGSAAELETQLIISNELGFIPGDKLNSILEKIDHISKMITSLINKLK